MEYEVAKVSPDEISGKNDAAESSRLKEDVAVRIPSSVANNIHPNTVDQKGGDIASASAPVSTDVSGEVNMEASITTDDVLRAGGLGARDDINSFLPVASDSTDFEETILDARNYEEPQEKISRPGLGWTEAAERK